ncbi:Photosystem I PsaG/PsaK protein [Raphanus sativus]|nr:Photosystem I PsaG/PsaK protein [Raphanus sativus]
MASTVMTTLPQFNGLRASKISAAPVQGLATVVPMRRKGNGALGAKCDFIGSSTNLIMVTSTTLMLFAGRFGLAPSANRKATAGLKLEARDSGLQTGDPAGSLSPTLWLVVPLVISSASELSLTSGFKLGSSVEAFLRSYRGIKTFWPVCYNCPN